MIKEKIAIIGVGNMGGAIAEGLLEKKVVSPTRLVLSNPSVTDLVGFLEKGVGVTSDNVAAVRGADVVVLAVKPGVFPIVLRGIAGVVSEGQLIVSVAAGVTIDSIQKVLGYKQAVVRVMPNLCASVGASMSVWVKSSEVTREQSEIVKGLLLAIGREVEVESEDLIDAATAISGSGPAYVFYLAEVLEKEARRLGLPADVAGVLARQTIVGSGKILGVSPTPAGVLRERVTSKGGTTEASFRVFEREGLGEVLAHGIRAAWERAKEMS